MAKILKRQAYKRLSGSGVVSIDRLRLYLQNKNHIEEAIEKFKMKEELSQVKVSAKQEQKSLVRNQNSSLESAERPKKKIRLSYKIGKGSRTLEVL